MLPARPCLNPGRCLTSLSWVLAVGHWGYAVAPAPVTVVGDGELAGPAPIPAGGEHGRHDLREDDDPARDFSPNSPFHPNVINDPTNDINCEDSQCDRKPKEACRDFPERMCRAFGPCVGKVPGGNVCLHKDLFPILADDLPLFGAIAMIGVCAGVTGIGGGGLNVPMLLIWSKFNIKEAVPMSHAAVMGNALAMFLLNVRQRHPAAPQRPLIHYELAFLVLPAMLGGNTTGVVVGRSFPPTMLIVLSLALLLLTTAKTAHRGIKVHRCVRAQQEEAALAARQPCQAAPPAAMVHPCERPFGANGHLLSAWPSVGGGPAPRPPPAPGCSHEEDILRRTWSGQCVISTLPTAARTEAAVGKGTPAQAAAEAGRMRVPWQTIGLMVACNVFFCLDAAGMKAQKLCSPPYWALLLAFYPVMAASLGLSTCSLRRLARWHEARGDPPVEGDVEVTAGRLVGYPLAALLIGLVAGLLGLGGGEFMVPLLLEIGLEPRVASATSGFLMLLTTGNNVTYYFLAGTMRAFLGYSTALFFTTMAAGTVGVLLRDTAYIRARLHLMVYLLALLLLTSALLLAYRGLYQAWPDLEWHFMPFCRT